MFPSFIPVFLKHLVIRLHFILVFFLLPFSLLYPAFPFHHAVASHAILLQALFFLFPSSSAPSSHTQSLFPAVTPLFPGHACIRCPLLFPCFHITPPFPALLHASPSQKIYEDSYLPVSTPDQEQSTTQSSYTISLLRSSSSASFVSEFPHLCYFFSSLSFLPCTFFFFYSTATTLVSLFAALPHLHPLVSAVALHLMLTSLIFAILPLQPSFQSIPYKSRARTYLFPVTFLPLFP